MKTVIGPKARAAAVPRPNNTLLPWQAILVAAVALAVMSWSVMPAGARPAPTSFADLVEKLSPAVVNISTTQKIEARGTRFPGTPELGPFDEFFREFFDRRGGGGGQGREREVQSLGSGFVIDPSGFIVTNNHVVGEATDIQVNFSSGLTLPAEIVGTDEATDLAVIKVDHSEALPSVRFGNSDNARVGDWVLAIGNPFSLGRSVTAGIISGRNRDIRAGRYDDFIQTDAAINRGNSGGPLFDIDGSVIGVNTVIISPSGGSVGIGFAISSSLAESVVSQLIDHGEARRGWLGVGIQGVNDDLAEAFGLKDTDGALVSAVNEDSPAAKAGIQVGDIILRFDGSEIEGPRQLSRVVASTEIGKRVQVELWREGVKKTVRLRTGRLEADVVADMSTPGAGTGDAGGERKVADLGITIAPITDTRARAFKVDENTRGVLVVDVDADGPSASKLRPGDVIVEVDQQEVSAPKEITDKVSAKVRAKKDLVLLLLERRGTLAFVPVRFDGRDE